MRYIIGGGGLIYEVAVDKLRNPTALVVFGGIAGIPDVLGYRAVVKRQAEADASEQSECEADASEQSESEADASEQSESEADASEQSE